MTPRDSADADGTNDPVAAPSDWSVHKFGGTSLADAAGFERAARLVAGSNESGPTAIVVSAIKGVTDALIDAARSAAASGGEASERALETVVQRTAAVARELLGDPVADRVVAAIEQDAADVRDVLRGIRVARSCTKATLDVASGFGEVWSARILHAHLESDGKGAQWLDAREVLVVSRGETGPVVHWDETERRLEAWLREHGVREPGGSEGGARERVVITGYIAVDEHGAPTTLERNGSDLSASIFARLLGARSITIWTDVDGVLSADPRLVPEAVVLDELTYEEAMELAYFGARVLHPHTMAPAIERGIPIHIRNASRPDAPGTRIRARRQHERDREPETRQGRSPRSTVRGFSLSEDLALLDVAGAGMIGVPGIASRLFTALREIGVSVRMISQASSEHSICVAIPRAQGDSAKAAVERAFAPERAHGQIQTVDVTGPYSILAAVGDGMVETPGVAARLFRAMGSAGVNVRAVAQGSSERNISVVVSQDDAARALRAVHAGFYLSDQTLSVGLVGPGSIGAELLGQLRDAAERLHSRFAIDLRVRGIASSRSMVLDDSGVDLARWESAIRDRGEPVDLDAFAGHVHAEHLPHAVIVDCTASEMVAERYADWLSRGIHVITPNKKANSASLDCYRRLRELSRNRNAHYLYEATVGAGLPVITTLRDLIETGDRVERIEGVLSGTLSFLLNSFTGEQPFSAIAAEAHRRGYTEPDPREDLSGVDVARKALILARELGLELELSDVRCTGLVPDALRDTEEPDAFLAGLSDYDRDMERRRADAEQNGEVLRYVAVVDVARGADRRRSGAVEVGLRTYPVGHPFARLTGGDNLVAFTTDRYRELPLIVQGPGAGPAVTAGGVFADLLRLASYLGARP